MGGRHRNRVPDPRARRLLATAVSVLAVSGVTAATVLGVGPIAVPQAATSASLLAPPVGPGTPPETGPAANGTDGSGADGSGATGADPTAGAPAGSDPTPGDDPAPTPATLLGGLPDGASAVLATSGARTAATTRAAVRSDAAVRSNAARGGTGATAASTRTGVCDPDGPPRFDDPAHPDEITNRDCGYTDARARTRSHDPWIDDQLRSSYGQ